MTFGSICFQVVETEPFKHFFCSCFKVNYFRKAVNHFRKKLHLRCLTEIWIRVWHLTIRTNILNNNHRRIQDSVKHLWWSFYQYFRTDNVNQHKEESITQTVLVVDTVVNVFKPIKRKVHILISSFYVLLYQHL